MSETRQDLMGWIAQYGQLSHDSQVIAAPYLAEIKALEIKMEDAIAHLTFQMETLKPLITSGILEIKEGVKAPFVTAIYSHSVKWDGNILDEIGKEIPAVLQARKEIATVSLRKTTR